MRRDVEAASGRLLRVLFVRRPRLPAQTARLAHVPRPLPLADLIVCHARKNAVLVAKAEIPSREPPLDGPTDHGAVAPAIRLAPAFIVLRVMDALGQRPDRKSVV